jgi:hypothetical protein
MRSATSGDRLEVRAQLRLSSLEGTTLGEGRRIGGHEHQTRDLGRQACCKTGRGRHEALGVESSELPRLVVVTLHAQGLDHMLAPSRRGRAGELVGRGLVPGRHSLQEPAALGDEHLTVILHDARSPSRKAPATTSHFERRDARLRQRFQRCRGRSAKSSSSPTGAA